MFVFYSHFLGVRSIYFGLVTVMYSVPWKNGTVHFVIWTAFIYAEIYPSVCTQASSRISKVLINAPACLYAFKRLILHICHRVH